MDDIEAQRQGAQEISSVPPLYGYLNKHIIAQQGKVTAVGCLNRSIIRH